MFLLVAGLVMSLQWINSFAAKNWKLFSTQNYFDANGIFIGTIFGIPLILMALFILFNGLYRSSQSLIAVKKKEFLQAQKAKSRDSSNSKKLD
jgi:hypothetical protein